MKFLNKYLILVLLFLLTGCGLWRNFTTYFNRYYNTSLHFDNAMDEISKQKRDIFSFKEDPVPQAAKQSLDKVVEKASKILQFDSQSAFFDDALLLIGKSFYYLQEYSKAYRKFQELATLTDSDLLLENKLWIGKTQLQLRLFDDGIATLDEVRDESKQNGEIDIFTEASIKQIAFYKYREDYIKAIENAKVLLEETDNDQLNAELTNEIGKLYVQLEDFANAATYFAKVSEYEPSFEIEFSSKLELAKLYKLLNERDKSLKVLLDLKDQNRYKPFLDKINLEIGLIKYDQGDYQEALNIFTEVDTTFKQSESGFIAAFMKAELFTNFFKNYDSAKVFYDKVSTGNSPTEYKDKAKKKSEILKKFLTLRESVNKYKKQLYYIENPEAFSQDSLDYVIWKNRDSSVIKAEQEEAKRNKTTVKTLVMPIKSTISGDSLKKIMAKFEYDFGNVFFGELSEPDSAYKYYISIINYPPNSYTAKTYFALATYYDSKGEKEKADSLYKFVYDNYPKEPMVNVIAKKLGLGEIDFSTDPLENEFLEAEKHYKNKDFKIAINKLKKIYKENDKSMMAAKSIYTIGFIYENDLRLPDSAVVYYDTLNIKYKNTEYARNVAAKLNFFKQEEKRKQAVKDSIAKAKEDSIKAEKIRVEKEKLKNKLIDSLKKAGEDVNPQDIDEYIENNYNFNNIPPLTQLNYFIELDRLKVIKIIGKNSIIYIYGYS